MENILTTDNLLTGIQFWRTKKTKWPSDFHNEFYQTLADLKQNGLSEAWWWEMVNYLSRWKALRPLTKEEIRVRGVERLQELQASYDAVIKLNVDQPLNLATATWEHLEQLYDVAFDIKGVDRPVFGSKLCHFLLPDVFPVIDHDVIGVNTRFYSNYWLFCNSQWTECSIQVPLQQMLKAAIGTAAHVEYPYSTKVTELCIIGSRV